MVVAHVMGNILFIIFLYFNIYGLIVKKRPLGKIAVISYILGCVVYIIYIIMIITNFKVYGFDKQSFSMLILAWAFEKLRIVYQTRKIS